MPGRPCGRWTVKHRNAGPVTCIPSFGKNNLECPCAVPRRRSSVGASPTWQLLLQPVAIGAVVEVTKLPKPPMERVAWRPREQAGRNVSERRAGLGMIDAGADPADIWGRPLSSLSGEQPDPRDGPAGVVATACLYRENARNTGDPKRWVCDPTGRPRGTGRAAWGVGEVQSTVDRVMPVEGRDLTSGTLWK